MPEIRTEQRRSERLGRRRPPRPRSRVTPRSAASSSPHSRARHRVLAADRRAPVRRVVGAEGQPHARGAQRRERVRRVARDRRRATTLDVGHTSSTVPRSASSATSAGSSTARTPWPSRVTGTGSASARADARRARPLARVDRCSPSPASCGDREGARERPGREAGLVAGQAEAGDVGVRLRRRPCAAIASARSDAEVAHRGERSRGSRCRSPRARRRSPAAMPATMSRVGQPGRRRRGRARRSARRRPRPRPRTPRGSRA